MADRAIGSRTDFIAIAVEGHVGNWGSQGRTDRGCQGRGRTFMQQFSVFTCLWLQEQQRGAPKLPRSLRPANAELSRFE